MLPVVSLAAPHERLAALRLLFPSLVDAPHAGINAAGLFVSHDAAGSVRGAILVQSIAGALGIAVPPRAKAARDADALAAAACDWLRGRGVKVCQAFAAAAEMADVAPLERNGFRHVTQLVSMQREVSASSPPDRAFTFVADTPPFTEQFRAVLLDTHTDTRDCPELNGSRTADNLLAGFDDGAPGNSCHFAIHEGVPVGVVMLANAEPDAVELTYLGVVPAVRRRGFGRELLAFAIAEAVRSRVAMLMVTVDSRNEPALRLYRRHGFTETDRREVWLAQFSSEPLS